MQSSSFSIALAAELGCESCAGLAVAMSECSGETLVHEFLCCCSHAECSYFVQLAAARQCSRIRALCFIFRVLPYYILFTADLQLSICSRCSSGGVFYGPGSADAITEKYLAWKGVCRHLEVQIVRPSHWAYFSF